MTLATIMSIEHERGLRLRPAALRALRVLEMCPMIAVDTFGPMVGLASESAAYQLLARLRARGLAEVRREDLGFLLGDRLRGLWCISDLGRRVLRGAIDCGDANGSVERTRQRRRPVHRHLLLRVACYRLIAWFLAAEREQGLCLVVLRCEIPWIRELQAGEDGSRPRVRLPGAAYIASMDAPHSASSSNKPLLLLPDLGTAPVARYGEALRRVIIHMERGGRHPNESDELLVAAPDTDGRATRAGAWWSLMDRVVRREHAAALRVRVVSWGQVDERLGGSRWSALLRGEREAVRPVALGPSRREEVLHFVGRHPLLTVAQLADLLATTRRRIEVLQRALIDGGWLRAVEVGNLRAVGRELDSRELPHLGLVEVTDAGRRRLANLLALDASAARRYHGLIGSGRAEAAGRRRLLRALEHTMGTNDVFVAFARAAAEARRRGWNDELSEWRGAAACERRRCKPDGYGLYTRNGTSYGFLLEFDRGTESTRKYAAKFRSYYRYRDSGQAARDYNGLPTILFVTTSASAEDRIAQQAYRAWFSRGTDPLPVLLTTTHRIAAHADGVLGRIWRTPGETSGDLVQRNYWLPSSAELSSRVRK